MSSPIFLSLTASFEYVEVMERELMGRGYRRRNGDPEPQRLAPGEYRISADAETGSAGFPSEVLYHCRWREA